MNTKDIPNSAMLLSRLMKRVEINQDTGCWEVLSGLQKGYSLIKYKGVVYRGHRVSYTALVGCIPGGMSIDHLCMVKNCINPNHLEPVSLSENVSRCRKANVHFISGPTNTKLLCRNGHWKIGDNLQLHRYKDGRVRRTCKQCHRDASLKSYYTAITRAEDRVIIVRG